MARLHTGNTPGQWKCCYLNIFHVLHYFSASVFTSTSTVFRSLSCCEHVVMLRCWLVVSYLSKKNSPKFLWYGTSFQKQNRKYHREDPCRPSWILLLLKSHTESRYFFWTSTYFTTIVSYCTTFEMSMTYQHHILFSLSIVRKYAYSAAACMCKVF